MEQAGLATDATTGRARRSFLDPHLRPVMGPSPFGRAMQGDRAEDDEQEGVARHLHAELDGLGPAIAHDPVTAPARIQ